MGEIVRHDLVELSLRDVAEFEMLDLYALARIADLVDLRLHLVEVTLQPLL